MTVHEPGRLERVVGAEAAGLVEHALRRCRRRRSRCRSRPGRGPARAGPRSRSTQMIRSAPCSRAPGDRAEADHARAEHDARRARLDLGGEHRGAEAGRQPAGEQRGSGPAARPAGTLASAISGITVYSANVLVPMKWRIGSPSRESRAVPSGRWPWFCCSRIAMQRFVRGRQAVHALAALRREQRHHVVADRDVGDALADRLDDAGALVAEHGRRVAGRVGAGGRVHVGVADAAGDEPDQHLARLGLREVDLLDRQRRPELLEYRSPHSHGATLPRVHPASAPGGPPVELAEESPSGRFDCQAAESTRRQFPCAICASSASV